MSYTERFDAATAKMDELKDKMEKASEEIKASWKQGVDQIKSDIDFNRETIEEISEEADRKRDLRIEEKIDKFIYASETIKESEQQGATNLRSDMDMLRENLRDIAEDLDEQHELVSAKKEAKVEEARAKLQATANKIYEIGQSFERVDQEELILDLLTYAEECQELADLMTDEAELALKAAAEQIAIYNEKFGDQ